MLTELSVHNYAVIESLRLELGPGFNVLTGETGAGKSIILGAIGLLLGDRADATVIRAGAERAYVEGVFEVPALKALIEKVLGTEMEDGSLIVSREITKSGRNICRINSRTVPRKLLLEVGVHLVDVHGQSTHLSLLRPATQRELLDRYGGLVAERQAFGAAAGRILALRKELAAAQQRLQDLDAKQELMQFQSVEIAKASPEPGEDDALAARRSVMVNSQAIIELLAQACAALDGDDAVPEAAAGEMVGRAVRALASLEGIDPEVREAKERADSIVVQIRELVSDLRDYADTATFDPQELKEVEERLEVLSVLKRKYGPTIDDVIEFGAQLEKQLAGAQRSEQELAELAKELDEAKVEAGGIACALDRSRAEAASKMAAAAEKQLRFLGMEHARLAVSIRHRSVPDGLPAPTSGFVDYDADSGSAVEVARIDGPVRFSAQGAADVEFLISANPGEPLRPLASVASGGETSRVMLAIKSALAEVDEVPTLIFDEVDAGIGGRTGEAVGMKLASLGGRHQVLAVTHLPQIAAHGTAHVSARKLVEGDRTTTAAVLVEGEERVKEITRMLGSETAATREKAAELLREAGKTRSA